MILLAIITQICFVYAGFLFTLSGENYVNKNDDDIINIETITYDEDVMFDNMSQSERIEYLEKKSEKVTHINQYQTFIVRLDGKNFSRQTQNLVKPFDDVFSQAMMETAKNILQEFNSCCVYTQSDEISVVMKAMCQKEDVLKKKGSTHIFNGRVSKILSVMAGYTSTRFTMNFLRLLRSSNLDTHKNYLETHNDADFCFDARAIVIPLNRNYEVVHAIMTRSVSSGYKNFVSTISDFYLGKKVTFKKNTTEKEEMLKAVNVKITDYPSHCKYGWLVKNNMIEIETSNGKACRNKPCAKSLKLYYSLDVENMMLGKYWNYTDGVTFDEEE